MAMKRRRGAWTLESLEPRLALSAGHPAHVAAEVSATALTNVSPAETLALLNAFTRTYLSRAGDANYNPAFDFNHNGQIGQTDGKILLHALPPVSRKVPLKLTLTLAPADRAHGPLPKNSGGITHSQEPTVLGHTIPGALIFSGTGLLDAKLHGPAVISDANGNFSYKVPLTDGVNQLDFQVVDPYGRQLFRADPIFWLNFARYQAAHPRKG